jgi:hypothetical protein
MNPRDMAGRTAYDYERECVIYLAKSVRIARAGLARHQALNIVGDEARCSNVQIMTLFISTPISQDTSHGFVAPTQINPDMHLDFDCRSIGARIGNAIGQAAFGLPCTSKPQADPLVSTWHVCQCLDNALASSMAAGGLYHFRPAVKQMPLHETGRGGRYSRSKDGRWRLTLETDSGPVHRWLFPGPDQQENPVSILGWRTKIMFECRVRYIICF